MLVGSGAIEARFAAGGVGFRARGAVQPNLLVALERVNIREDGTRAKVPAMHQKLRIVMRGISGGIAHAARRFPSTRS